MMEKTEKNVKFAERLFKLRSALPFINRKIVGQKVVAERAGISEGSYNKAERGYIPGKAVLFLLAKYFNVTVDYLEKGQTDHVSEGMTLYQRSKLELQDGEGPWGKTRRREVEGAHIAITEFEPKNGQMKGPLRAAMEGLGEIFDSNDPILIPAIQANIRAFRLSARRERENTQQAHQIKVLEDKCDEFKDELDSMKETVNTLKKKIEENSSSGPAEEAIERKVI